MDSRFSIITVCFNCEGLIEKTIQSIICQTYVNIQFIIIDGGSTDNTLNIINKYQSKIDIIISEKDNGIYDAMNKGLQYASGDLIYFINAGDYLCNNRVLENVNIRYNRNEDFDLLYGDYYYYDDNGMKLCSINCRDIIDLLGKGWCHQTIFTKREIFKRYGGFDTNYRIYADFEWYLRLLIRCKLKTVYIGIPVVCYLKGGESEKSCYIYFYEWLEIIKKYVGRKNYIKSAIHYPKSFFLSLFNYFNYIRAMKKM